MGSQPSEGSGSDASIVGTMPTDCDLRGLGEERVSAEYCCALLLY
jgi:hypothetical protein